MLALFLYRQYVENAIIDALHVSQAFVLKEADKTFGHDLDTPWKEAKCVLANFESDEALGSLSETISEFDTLDRRADAFRHAGDRNDQKHVKDHGTVVSDDINTQSDSAYQILKSVIETMRGEERKLNHAVEEAVAKDPY